MTLRKVKETFRKQYADMAEFGNDDELSSILNCLKDEKTIQAGKIRYRRRGFGIIYLILILLAIFTTIVVFRSNYYRDNNPIIVPLDNINQNY